MSQKTLPRMRIRKGRVMHAVIQRFDGGDIESQCRTRHPVKGVETTLPRASAPADWWTDERYWYPDCQHCPEQPNLEPGAYLIWSNHHQCWFAPNGCGYRSNIAFAGRYDWADTHQWLGRGCGCCKVPEVRVPTPPIETLNDPEALMEYSRVAPREATRRAIRAGEVSKWYEPKKKG